MGLSVQQFVHDGLNFRIGRVGRGTESGPEERSRYCPGFCFNLLGIVEPVFVYPHGIKSSPGVAAAVVEFGVHIALAITRSVSGFARFAVSAFVDDDIEEIRSRRLVGR